MKDQEECEKAYLANGIPEDSDESDSEDEAYMNNTDDSVFLAKKLKTQVLKVHRNQQPKERKARTQNLMKKKPMNMTQKTAQWTIRIMPR